MSISCDLEGHDEDFVHSQIEAGRYRTANEVVHKALSLMKASEAAVFTLDAKLAEGLADIEAGRVHDVDGVFDSLLAQLAQTYGAVES